MPILYSDPSKRSTSRIRTGQSLALDDPPNPPSGLNDSIGQQAAQQPVESGPAPWPELWSVENKAQSDMPADSQAQGKNNPLSHQRHTSLLRRDERAARNGATRTS